MVQTQVGPHSNCICQTFLGAVLSSGPQLEMKGNEPQSIWKRENGEGRKTRNHSLKRYQAKLKVLHLEKEGVGREHKAVFIIVKKGLDLPCFPAVGNGGEFGGHRFLLSMTTFLLARTNCPGDGGFRTEEPVRGSSRAEVHNPFTQRCHPGDSQSGRLH